MAKSDFDQTLALAAALQFAYAVHDIASRGYCDKSILETAIRSVMAIDAPDAVSIYGSLKDLRPGIEQLRRQLEQPINDLPTRYTMSMVALEKKLQQNKKVSAELVKGISKTQQQAEFFDNSNHENVVAGLAHVYRKTISNLNPKIMVNGEAQHLNNERCASQIRTLLLAGIRAIVLWRQSGGSKWSLIFKRKKYHRCVMDMLHRM